MVDPPLSDGETRAPRKHRPDKSSGPRDGNHRTDDGYNSDRTASRNHGNHRTEDGYNSDRTASRNQHERSQNRHQDVYPEERTNSRHHHDDRSRGRYQERDRHYEERRTDRSQRERDGYREREKYPAEREHNRHQSERSWSSYEERDRYPERDDYHHDRSRNWDRREQERYVDKQRHPASSKGSDHYYPTERTFAPSDAQINDMEYYEPEPAGGILDCHKCRYLCTGRGMLQILEVILNALVLICIISSYFVLSGFSAGMASGGFGGGYYPFEGQELQQVRQLDQEFTVLRSPLIYGGVTVSLLMASLTLAVLAAGSKHLLSLSVRWLVFELAFSVVASLAYCAAVGVFLHFALQINSTDVCKRRERLYARNGLTWMNCDLAGTDGGAATFAIILIILYGASAVLAVRAYRERTSLQQ